MIDFFKRVPNVRLLFGTFILVWTGFAVAVTWSWVHQDWLPLMLSLCVGYLHNTVGQSIALHKFFTHKQFAVSKPVEWILAVWSVATGYPAVGYAAVHRRHHLSADTDQDPHRPATITSFLRCLLATGAGSLAKSRELALLIHDDEFRSCFGLMNKHFVAIWMVLLITVWIAFGWFGVVFGLLLPAWYCQVLGGGMINAFGHWHGYRNFDTPDHSTNSWLVNLFVSGEGYQNNHHHDASLVNFAVKPGEFDLAYWLIKISGIARPLRTNHVASD